MSRQKPMTWVVLVRVFYKKEDNKEDELAHIEVEDYLEPLAQSQAISIARNHWPAAQGFQLVYTTPLDKDGKPVHASLSQYTPTVMVADDEKAELKSKALVLAQNRASEKPTYRPTTVVKSSYPTLDLPELFDKESMATLCDDDGVLVYGTDARVVDVIPRTAQGGE